MGNIERRLARLESHIGKSTNFVVIRPGETEDQAKERYVTEHPENTSARLVFFVIKGRFGVGPLDRPNMGTETNVSESSCTGKTRGL